MHFNSYNNFFSYNAAGSTTGIIVAKERQSMTINKQGTTLSVKALVF